MKRFDYRFLSTANAAVIPDMVAAEDAAGWDLVTIDARHVSQSSLFGLVFRKASPPSHDAVSALREIVARWRAPDTATYDPGYASEDYWSDRFESVLSDLDKLIAGQPSQEDS